MFIIINCFGQSRHDRLYEVIGLPDGDEIADSLKIAIPLIILGFLIAYIFMWSKKDSSKVDNASTNVGCLGVIIMAVGFFFLLPLWAWVEAIFVSAMNIGILLIVVFVIIYFIYSAFSNKK